MLLMALGMLARSLILDCRGELSTPETLSVVSSSVDAHINSLDGFRLMRSLYSASESAHASRHPVPSQPETWANPNVVLVVLAKVSPLDFAIQSWRVLTCAPISM